MATKTFTATKDASMLLANDGWSGWDDHHPVGSFSGNRFRSVIYFPINFAGMTSINFANMYIRGHRAGSGNHVLGNTTSTRSLYVRRMIYDWGEGTDRGENLWSSQEVWGWSNRATAGTTWNEAIRFFTGYAEGTWYGITITDIVKQWQDGSVPNYGVSLSLPEGSDETTDSLALEFYSRHAGAASSPYIIIDYVDNNAPTAPTALSPTGDALVNSLTPTLTGTRADPDTGDYITAYQIQLYADDGTTLIWDSGQLTVTGTSIVFSKVYSGPSLVGNTFYKWKARTRDKGSLWSPYSALQRFKVNTPPNPPTLVINEPNTTDVLDITPDFVLTHSDNDPGDSKMYGYKFILFDPAGTAIWNSGDIDISGAPVQTLTLSYTGPALSWATQYYLVARTKDSNGVWGNYTSNVYFTTHRTGVPINLYPSGGEVISGLIPLFSGAREDADDTITGYEIQLLAADQTTILWNSGVLTAGISSGTTFSNTYSGSALSYNTTYYWRARLTGSIGGVSNYSALQAFSTPFDASIPTQNLPTPNNSPTNNNVTSLTPTFTGSRTSSAFTHYQIEVYPSTATSSNLGSPIWDSTDTTQASSTSYSRIYSGTALLWNTTYKWRVRVGNPTLGAWSGLASFLTDAAGTPTLTSPANNAWITTTTPTFQGSASGGDSITAVRILVFDATGTAGIWDSGDLSQSAASTFSKVYAGPALQTGVSYRWQARYTKSTGPTGGYSTLFTFRVNGAPTVPTGLEPLPGSALNGTLLPIFKAQFNDPEIVGFGDFPSSWVIEIRNNATDALIQTKTLTTGLSSGMNTYVWGSNTGGADTALSYGVFYKWRTYFVDSKSASGAVSSYQVFHAGQPPTINITDPSNGSNINTTRPTITWSFSSPSSQTQAKLRVIVRRSSNSTTVYDSGLVVSTAHSFRLPAGYLNINGEDYDIYVYVVDTDGLNSNTDVADIQLQLNAPPPITGLSATVRDDKSRIDLNWTASSLSTAFVTYVVYRRKATDENWTMIAVRKPETSTSFSDYYVGQNTSYEYRVTVVKLISGEPDLESPDSDIVPVRMASDVWMVVGQDRSDDHIFELPVNEESHNRPVQQEVFEPLGTNRKAVVRGFVLGNEGSLTLHWTENEAPLVGPRMDYLLYYPGPHILKDPFGNVYDVTFAGPDSNYLGGGSLQQTITWIEVGSTNNPGLTPDEFLAQIGAE